MSAHPTRDEIASAALDLVRGRPHGTVCPSEVARALGGDTWRDLMPTVRDVALQLRRDGALRITQGGVDVPGEELRGPIRLAPPHECRSGAHSNPTFPAQATHARTSGTPQRAHTAGTGQTDTMPTTA